MRSVLIVLALSVGATEVNGQRRVWIVDRSGGPGVHFTDIQPALDAAAAGDRVEVRGVGPYDAFQLSKGLDLDAIPGAYLETGKTAVVERIPAGQSARVAGFTISPGDLGYVPPPPAALTVRNCVGPVLLADLTLEGAAAANHPTAPGCRVQDSTTVLMQDSTSRPYGWSVSSYGGPGLEATGNTSLTLQRCTLTGGDEYRGVQSPSGPPGPGLLFRGVALIASATVCTGGAGVFGSIHPLYGCQHGGTGAPGVDGSGDMLFLARSSLLGGRGGNAITPCRPGQTGPAIVARSGPARVTQDCVTLGSVVGARSIPPLPTVQAPATAPRGSQVLIVFRGAPGAALFVLVDFRHDHVAFAGFEGALLVTTRAIPVMALAVGASGLQPVSFPVPMFPAVANEYLFLQAVARDSVGLSLTDLAALRIR